VNVALNRPAYQVSVKKDWLNIYRYASNANDGSRNTHMQRGPCTHTELETNPWWAVDLGVKLHVYGVQFTNRNSFGKFVVSLFSGDFFKF